MACMTHSCEACGWSDFDNTRHGPSRCCPKCGSDRVHHDFDERPDRDWADEGADGEGDYGEDEDDA